MLHLLKAHLGNNRTMQLAQLTAIQCVVNGESSIIIQRFLQK